MRQFFVMLAGIVMASIIGVTLIPAPDKPYIPNSYYTPLVGDAPPDFKNIYNSYNKSTVVSNTGSDKSSKPYPINQKPYQPNNKRGFLWFWTVEGDVAPAGVMKEYDEELNPKGFKMEGDLYKWELPKSERYLISVANGTLFPRSQTPIKPYPSTEVTLGVHLTYIVQVSEEQKAYRITYGSMERWWTEMGKTKPDDGTATKPIYYSDVSFGEDLFTGGSVVGLAGVSGVPSSDVPILLVRIEECAIDELGRLTQKWVNSSLESLYPN